MIEKSWRQQGVYRFEDAGPSNGPAVLLLHGMLGGADNWAATATALARAGYRVVVPHLPVYDLSSQASDVAGLVEHVDGFVRAVSLPKAIIGGNSLGGHVAVVYAADHPERVAGLMLTGSSGLYELDLGTSVLRRRDRAFIRERASLTFYDPSHVTEALVDEVYDIVNDRARALRLIRMARSVQADSVAERLADIRCPTLLIWGEDDRLTPPFVAREFQAGIADSELCLIPECGHAPMMEHPDLFAAALLAFVGRVQAVRERVS